MDHDWFFCNFLYAIFTYVFEILYLFLLMFVYHMFSVDIASSANNYSYVTKV